MNPALSDGEEEEQPRTSRRSNNLPLHGSEKTMNLNSMVLTNVLNSVYFKNVLVQLKTYHEVVDEIYNHVYHLEPWEKGSRKLAGQVGMCGGVRGVGTGGIVSSAFCLLFKLFTLRLTRKQVNGLINHRDSPYIRGIGFLYIRYTQPPADLWDWFEAYLDDEEEVDPKAGGGNLVTVGQMCQEILSKLEWYGTLFPRIPVPVQKLIEERLREHRRAVYAAVNEDEPKEEPNEYQEETDQKVTRSSSKERGRDLERDRERRRSRSRSRDRRHGSRERQSRRNSREKRGKRSRSRDRQNRRPSRERKDREQGRRERRSRSRDRRSRSRDRSRRERSRSKDRSHYRERDRNRDKRGHSNYD